MVKTTFSNYDARTLSVGDAKAIHEAFRQAGIRLAQEVEVLIKEAGFDSDKLKELAPSPSGN